MSTPDRITLVRGAVWLNGAALDACTVDAESVQLAAAEALGVPLPIGTVVKTGVGAPDGADVIFDLALVKADGFTPPKGVQEAAARGLEMRREHGRGGTEVGVARARDLSNGRAVSMETIGRMVSFFARHESASKGAKGFNRGEEGYPSAGRIAWELWGGDPGQSWANAIWARERADKAEGDGMTVQSLIFDREKFPTAADVEQWINDHPDFRVMEQGDE